MEALGLFVCISLAIYPSIPSPLVKLSEASPPFRKHPPGSGSDGDAQLVHRKPPLLAAVRIDALHFVPGSDATVLRCCQGRTRAPHTVRQSPMTAPPPCGTGQTTDQRGAAALWPARYYGHEERLSWIPRQMAYSCALTWSGRSFVSEKSTSGCSFGEFDVENQRFSFVLFEKNPRRDSLCRHLTWTFLVSSPSSRRKSGKLSTSEDSFRRCDVD